MRVIQIGNFRPPHSTENHLLTAMRSHGWDVTPLQEDDLSIWPWLGDGAAFDLGGKVDFVLWTRTGWDWDDLYKSADGVQQAHNTQRRMLRRARDKGIAVVGYHLDIWWGLQREYQIHDEPFFDCTLMVTADGGHENHWRAYSIEHVWFPPAVSLPETELGMFRDEYHSKIAFVGSWQGHYHRESEHRFQLVDWLRRNYKRDCRFWPEPGRDAVRGADLRDLYQSVDVVVGDSCFAGSGLENYWSDRIPETVGRGAFLLHPNVGGLHHYFDLINFGSNKMCLPAKPQGSWEHLGAWDAGEWDQLGTAIEWALTHPEERREVAMSGRAHVRANHTYEKRMTELKNTLEGKDLI